MRIARMLLRSTGCSDYYANGILSIVGHKLICRTGCVLEGLNAIPFSPRARSTDLFRSVYTNRLGLNFNEATTKALKCR